MSSLEARIETLAAANLVRHNRKRQAVETALKSLRSERSRMTVSAVASRAQVSRNFVYGQPDLLREIQTAVAEQSDRLIRAQSTTSTEASLRRRLANALDALKENKRVIAQQQATIERLTGELSRRMTPGV
ncbi:DUF6262 domain-containing protein [Mycobacterium senriense]|uniref:Transposase n=1 Tax=Mycobacterium senriense TaxID=2775496 RepID=A0ABN6IHX6_9MYCO|nr:DUF6262 family protein [Mycobacterium senriense]BCZ22776.1 hypothetical protein MTY59_26310 [Mycobacterium senriense]